MRKTKEWKRETAKMADGMCMHVQRSMEAEEENSNESTDQTFPPPTRTDVHRDNASIEAEVQQLHWEYQSIEKKVMEATRNKDFCEYNEDDQNREREYGTKVRCTAEVQSPSERPRTEGGTQETREDALNDDSERSILSDVDMPILVGQQPNNADSDSNSSDESFGYGENEQQ